MNRLLFVIILIAPHVCFGYRLADDHRFLRYDEDTHLGAITLRSEPAGDVAYFALATDTGTRHSFIHGKLANTFIWFYAVECKHEYPDWNVAKILHVYGYEDGTKVLDSDTTDSEVISWKDSVTVQMMAISDAICNHQDPYKTGFINDHDSIGAINWEPFGMDASRNSDEGDFINKQVLINDAIAEVLTERVYNKKLLTSHGGVYRRLRSIYHVDCERNKWKQIAYGKFDGDTSLEAEMTRTPEEILWNDIDSSDKYITRIINYGCEAYRKNLRDQEAAERTKVDKNTGIIWTKLGEVRTEKGLRKDYYIEETGTTPVGISVKTRQDYEYTAQTDNGLRFSSIENDLIINCDKKTWTTTSTSYLNSHNQYISSSYEPDIEKWMWRDVGNDGIAEKLMGRTCGRHDKSQ